MGSISIFIGKISLWILAKHAGAQSFNFIKKMNANKNMKKFCSSYFSSFSPFTYTYYLLIKKSYKELPKKCWLNWPLVDQLSILFVTIFKNLVSLFHFHTIRICNRRSSIIMWKKSFLNKAHFILSHGSVKYGSVSVLPQKLALLLLFFAMICGH